MNWIAAVGAGVGLGLAYFGGLWLTVRGVVRRPGRAAWSRSAARPGSIAAGAGPGAPEPARRRQHPGGPGRALAVALVSWCVGSERRAMEGRGLSPAPLFHLGPVEVTGTVLYSLIASAC